MRYDAGIPVPVSMSSCGFMFVREARLGCVAGANWCGVVGAVQATAAAKAAAPGQVSTWSFPDFTAVAAGDYLRFSSL